MIYTNGCSHTRGNAVCLDNYNDAWPYLLAKHFDCQLDNQSTSGLSNDAIVERTMEVILGSAIPPDKVYIQFTLLDRFDTASVTHLPRSQVEAENYENSHTRFGSKYNNFYRDMFPRTKDIDTKLSHKLLNQMYLMQCFLIEHGIPDYRFMVWSAVDVNYPTYKHIDKTKVIFNVFNRLLTDFEVCDTPDPNRGGMPDGHFGSDAHRQIADWLINKYHVDNTDEKDYTFIDHLY